MKMLSDSVKGVCDLTNIFDTRRVSVPRYLRALKVDWLSGYAVDLEFDEGDSFLK
jgi:hypothetical protein